MTQTYDLPEEALGALHSEKLKELNREIMSLPFSGLKTGFFKAPPLCVSYGPGHVDQAVDSALHNIAQMREVLEEIADELAEKTETLARMQGDQAAVRRFFGITAPEGIAP